MKNILLITLISVFTLPAFACSCIYISDYFCETVSIALSNDWGDIYIVKAKVTDKYGFYMDISIEDNLLSSIEESDVTVLGQDGLNCNQPLGVFEVGDEVVLALYYGVFEEGKYDLSGCGKYYLHVEDGMMVGNVDETGEPYTYEKFVENLLTQCALDNDDEEVFAGEEANIFPNPANEFLNIQNLPSTGDFNLQIFNASGQLVAQNTLSSTPVSRIDVSQLPNGIYFARLSGEAALFSRKFIVSR